tara:strand:+ start:340 stop:741 length:402 start_codon:yes stop_codon:yes gene_type:complete
VNIGQAAKLSGIPAKTIRYYESVGLIPPASRTDSGYREYRQADVSVLKFVERARGLGFSIDDVSKLLSLWHNKARKSAQVKALAERHIKAIELKIRELETMQAALNHLVSKCHGDDRPDCPILDDLADTITVD